MKTLDDFIRQAIKAYLACTNMSAREFGVLALGDPGFVSSLESGRALRLGTADRLLQFMDEAPIGPEVPRRGRGVPVPPGHEALQARRGGLG